MLFTCRNTTGGPNPRDGADPCFALEAGIGTHGMPRALLIDGQNINGPGSSGAVGHRKSDEPGLALTSNGRQNLRAVLIGTTSDLPLTPAPAPTVRSSDHNQAPVAIVGARVVRLTPRCLARLQSLPDTYWLPGGNALAARVIGNGVPCLLAQRVMDQIDGVF